MGEPAAAMRAWSVIRLRREQEFYRDRDRRYRARIDGNPVGWITEGETKDFLVPPGEHRIRFTIDSGSLATGGSSFKGVIMGW